MAEGPLKGVGGRGGGKAEAEGRRWIQGERTGGGYAAVKAIRLAGWGLRGAL